MAVVRRLTEGDGLQLLEDPVLQRLTVAARRDVVAYLADLADSSRLDRGAGLMAFNSLLTYPAGTVGARIKAIITGIGAGQPWGDVAALLADLVDQIGEDQLVPALRDTVALMTAGAEVAGSVAAQVAAEATARAEAIADEADARALAIANEVVARNAAIEVETLARVDAIEQEVFDRGVAVAAEASARDVLATQLRGAYTGTSLAGLTTGLLFDERQARSSADGTEVTARQLLSTKLTGAADPSSLTLNTLASGLLFDEREARVSAVSAEASSRTTLATQLRGAYGGSDINALSAGLLFDERQARSTADATEVSARQSLSAKLTGVNDPSSLSLGTLASGLLYDEREARVSAVSAEASSRTSLATQLRGAYTGNDINALSAGLLYDERQLRSTADATEVSARQSLSAKLTGVNDPSSLTLGTLASGLLYDEREARVSAVSAEASSRTSLATQLRGAYGGSDINALSSGLLYDERQLRSAADATEVSARQALSAKLTGVNDPSSLSLATLSAGLVYEEREARATAVAAEAYERSLVAASLGSLSGAVSTEISVRTSQIAGVHSQYVLKAVATRSDGRVVMGSIGLASAANNVGSQSKIILQADEIVFVPGSNPNATPAELMTFGYVDGVPTLIVPAARIGDLTVGTAKLVDNAATSFFYVYDATSFSGNGSWQTILTYGFALPEEGQVSVVWQGNQGYSATGGFDVSIELNYVEIGHSRGGSVAQDAPVCIGAAAAAAGANLLRVRWSGAAGLNLSNQRVFINGSCK